MAIPSTTCRWLRIVPPPTPYASDGTSVDTSMIGIGPCVTGGPGPGPVSDPSIARRGEPVKHAGAARAGPCEGAVPGRGGHTRVERTRLRPPYWTWLDIPVMMTQPEPRLFHVWVIRDDWVRVTWPVFADTHCSLTR